MKRLDISLTKQKTILYCLFFLTFGILMIIGTPNDLEIDKKLFDYQNSFALFAEKYGMFPVHCLCLFAYSVLLAAYHKFDDALDIAQSFLPFIGKLRRISVIKCILFIIHITIYALFCYGAFEGSNEFLNFILGQSLGGNLQDLIVAKGAAKWIAVTVWTVARIALAAVVVVLLRKVKREHLKVLEFMAIAGLLMYQGSNVINMLKEHFHRIRFREMVAYSHGLIDANGMTARGNSQMPKEWVGETDFFAYTPWYKIGNDYGIYSEPESFPSGHTAAACFSMLLPMLVSKAKHAKRFFTPAFLLGFAYTLTVGITRLIRGAHYMTDIAAGAMIMMLMLMIIMVIMNYLERFSENKIKRIKRQKERNK